MGFNYTKLDVSALVSTVHSPNSPRGSAAGELALAPLALAPALQTKLNCFVDLLPHLANAQVGAINALSPAQRESLPLAGVPIVIKDNICIGPQATLAGGTTSKPLPLNSQGRTTCASNMLRNYYSPFTATAVTRLIAAGAVPIAKANMDEFGFGSSGEHSCFGSTRNPLALSRVPGGSSSGSAAAVASGIARVALGSDTGGSVRQPASFCGLAAMKPTYGRVSRYGLVAYASSLDQIGPIAKTARECALVLAIIAGACEHDATSAQHPTTDLHRALATLASDPSKPFSSPSISADSSRTLLAGKRIALPAQAHSEGNHEAVRDMLSHVRAQLTRCGATVVDVDMPSLRAAVAAYYIIAPAEASSNLARFDGVRYGHRASASRSNASEDSQQSLFDFIAKNRSEGFGQEAQRRILLGTHVLSSGYYDAYYQTALRARRLVSNEFARVFSHASCDAVLLPTTPGPAFPLASKSSHDPLAMYLEDVYTVPVNLCGLPALQIPAGKTLIDGASLPLGVQLIGPAFSDGALLTLGHGLEAALTA